MRLATVLAAADTLSVQPQTGQTSTLAAKYARQRAQGSPRSVALELTAKPDKVPAGSLTLTDSGIQAPPLTAFIRFGTPIEAPERASRETCKQSRATQ